MAPRPDKPNTINILAGIITSWQHTHMYMHSGLSMDPATAAREWVDLQEPPKPGETAFVKESDAGAVWRTPYLDRLTYTLKKYLKHPTEDRNLILAGIKAGIPWRGDEIDAYKHIIEETEIMREIGLDEYRKRALTAAAGLNLKMDA